ncbi:MAG: hypothetical protein JWL73_3310 [Actinomycetia bacterium]|nr:hypothetical protein [Actinomycetes bacterium]
MRVPTIERRRPSHVRYWAIGIAIAVLIVLLISLRGLAGFWTDQMWFKSIGQDQTWRSLLLAKLVPAFVFTAIVFVVLLANLIIADRLAPRFRSLGPEDEVIGRYQDAVAPYAFRIRIGIAILFALLFGVNVASHWQQWILFTHRVDFGKTDPNFHLDIGFYVFQLPFLKFIVQWTFNTLLMVFFITLIAHYLNGGIRLQTPFQRVTPQVKAHLSVLLGLMALVRAIQYFFVDRYELSFSSRGTVAGATYTDLHAQLPGLNLLTVIAVAAAILFLYNIFRRGWILPIIAVGLWAVVFVIVGGIYPALVQSTRVNPDEFNKELPYIRNNIAATRAAFGLDTVKVRQFDYKPNLDAAKLAADEPTIQNARLWGPDVIIRDFQSFQQLGTFYRFNDVDVDRYLIGGRLTQVLSSVRELNQDDLPSQTWVNRHLVYTHGYGNVVSPGNTAASDGLPTYLLSNIPPEGRIALKVPQVYFGEGLSGFSLVNAKQSEFDYPRKGKADATTRYAGTGGVKIGSGAAGLLRKSAFFLRFSDFNLLISNQVTANTRVLYLRDIRQRAQKAAPFLHLDADPYSAVIGGRTVWILDAYTTSSSYPNAQPASVDTVAGGQVNYIRNSVKITVDAYNGTMKFYVVDAKDPIIRAYEKAFPHLFTDGSKMSPELKTHLRYPEGLFSLQTNVYSAYHVTDPRTFYNKTDLWAVSPDPGTGVVGDTVVNSGVTSSTSQPTAASSSGARIDPYYLILRLPGESKVQFTLLRPFVPVSRNNRLTNLVSFMVAGSDPGEYGKLGSFVMPSGRTVAGPEQVNNTINNTEQISQEFTLLGGHGSQVIQGSLQLIPIGNSLLYIRPIYVQGQAGSQIPAFRQVVVVYNGVAKIDDTVQDALSQFFPDVPRTGSPTAPTATTTPGSTATTSPSGVTSTVSDLIKQAAQKYADAQTALKSGDLATYQSDVDAVGKLLQQAQDLSTSGTSTTTTTRPGTTTTSAGSSPQALSKSAPN